MPSAASNSADDRPLHRRDAAGAAGAAILAVPEGACDASSWGSVIGVVMAYSRFSIEILDNIRVGCRAGRLHERTPQRGRDLDGLPPEPDRVGGVDKQNYPNQLTWLSSRVLFESEL